MSDIDKLPPLPVLPECEVRHCIGYPGYCVTSDGHVFSCRGNRFRPIKPHWTQLKGSPHIKSRHLMIGLSAKRCYVHQVVLRNFVGPCPLGKEACHKDGSPTNNCVDNLYWGTRLENVRDAVRHGTWAHGESFSKVTIEQVAEIRRLYADGIDQHAIAKRFSISRANVSVIVTAKSWKHLGHVPIKSRRTHKLIAEQVVEIRKLCAAGTNKAEIAKRFGVDKSLIYFIRKRKIWKHLPD